MSRNSVLAVLVVLIIQGAFGNAYLLIEEPLPSHKSMMILMYLAAYVAYYVFIHKVVNDVEPGGVKHLVSFFITIVFILLGGAVPYLLNILVMLSTYVFTANMMGLSGLQGYEIKMFSPLFSYVTVLLVWLYRKMV